MRMKQMEESKRLLRTLLETRERLTKIEQEVQKKRSGSRIVKVLGG